MLPPNADEGAVVRKRKTKGEDEGSSEPRRLRRSHEACARCRSKKIKCDSKHPRCTACATAGLPCQQEDRHRQTLTPRGYTERLEAQLAQCEALLKRRIPGFSLEGLDDILIAEGIAPESIAPVGPNAAFQYARPNPVPIYPPPVMHYPPMMPYAPMPYLFQPPYPMLHKGIDPNGNDMSNAEALAKNFGVSDVITSGLKLDAAPSELPAPPSLDPAPRNPAAWAQITVRRPPVLGGASNHLSLYGPVSNTPTVDIWLPKDRKFVDVVVNAYFGRLNVHRPVFARKDFDRILGDLYAGAAPFHDPGHLCAIYLVLALGTLSELNHRAVDDTVPHLGSAVAKKLMPPDWPEHGDFFERAMTIKPDLRVTLSSLQALILLHWYLYIERQGRTLWRLVGALVRLGVELGLHHDPTTQVHEETGQHIFSDEESQLRIRLWGIILIHDRGTSILLGRPLAISPADSNTPHPSRAKNYPFCEISEHFELSHPVADIQADIINSLYTPTRQAGDTIMRNATRIIKSMSEFRRGLPERYKYYFSGSDEWSMPQRMDLVQKITEDEGLTLLKIGIARVLMLRALFSSKELTYHQKRKALVDAIITSHNIIIIHTQLIKFPDIAFFTSPIPIHIAAMVILYGHISKVECLPPHIALEDVYLALDMLPRFRWRWERKDLNGGHPLIARLAEHVMRISLHTVHPSGNYILMSEPDWENPNSDNGPQSPPSMGMSGPLKTSQHSTPVLAPGSIYSGPGGAVYGPQPRPSASGPMNRSHSGGSTPSSSDKLSQQQAAAQAQAQQAQQQQVQHHLADMPSGVFYPFFPEASVSVDGGPSTSGGNGGHHPGDYSRILRAAGATRDGYEPQPSQEYLARMVAAEQQAAAAAAVQAQQQGGPGGGGPQSPPPHTPVHPHGPSPVQGPGVPPPAGMVWVPGPPGMAPYAHPGAPHAPQ